MTTNEAMAGPLGAALKRCEPFWGGHRRALGYSPSLDRHYMACLDPEGTLLVLWTPTPAAREEDDDLTNHFVADVPHDTDWRSLDDIHGEALRNLETIKLPPTTWRGMTDEEFELGEREFPLDEREEVLLRAYMREHQIPDELYELLTAVLYYGKGADNPDGFEHWPKDELNAVNGRLVYAAGDFYHAVVQPRWGEAPGGDGDGR